MGDFTSQYRMSRTALAFHDALSCTLRGVMGPVASGKSSMCMMDGMNLAAGIYRSPRSVVMFAIV